MSSPVTPDHWRERLGDMPMPENATAEMMWAAEDAVYDMDSIEQTLKDIKEFENIWRIWLPRYRAANEQKHLNEAHRKEFENIEDIMRSLKTIIELYRKQLYDR